MNKKTVKDVELNGKKVLVRVDFNVPMKDGKITNDNRIVAALPTIKYILENGGRAILFSHLGKVKSEEDKASKSLRPAAERLAELLGKDVKFIPETRGAELEAAIAELKDGEVLMFENTRFEDLDGKKESKNDPELGKYWASLGDVFVNDAFGTAHRAHASNVGISANLEAVAGFLLEKEIEFIGGAVDAPQRPMVAILGGAKVSDKIGVITNLIENAGVDKILIGGKMANTFLKARGYNIGDSSYEEDKLETAEAIMKLAVEKGKELVLPTDLKVAQIPQDAELTPEVVEQAPSMVVNVEEGIPEGYQPFDIGEQTLDSYANALDGAKKVVWNGPLGYTEAPKYAVGTETVARYIAKKTKAKCVIGGGDSVAAVNKFFNEARTNGEDMDEFDERFHLSTGGGASLEFLEGKQLPGIAIIQNRRNKTISEGNHQGPTSTKDVEKEF